MNNTPLKTQIGGEHYKSLAIQPAEYAQRNKLGFIEGCVVKYVTRHRAKNGRQDIEKAIHFLQILLEIEYPQAAPNVPVYTPHNPHRLTQKQVGTSDGYRLLDEDEILSDAPEIGHIERRVGSVWDATGWAGTEKRYTYRTKLTREQLRAERTAK